MLVVASPVQDTDDFDRITANTIVDDIVAVADAAQGSSMYDASFADQRMVSQMTEESIDFGDQTIGGRDVVLGDIAPNPDQIVDRFIASTNG